MDKARVSFDAVAHLRREVGDEGWAALADPENLRMTKRFAAWLVRRVMLLLMPTSLSDEEAVARFPQIAAKVVSWRKYATAIGYKGPVVWLTRKGFTLKTHAPFAGPCQGKLAYLQGWPLRNDEPTMEAIVYWVPRLAQDSTSKTSSQMEVLRTELKARHNLPENHCDRFGSIALLFALILRHFKLSGERVPLKYLYAASDTFHGDGHRLIAGNFDGRGLNCSFWHGDAIGDVGFFLLGVEELGTS